MSDPRPRLYLVDGSTYIFRAFYAIRNMSNSKGMPTNAIYGFTSMLLKLIEEEQPDYLVMVFDKSGRSFRNDVYPEYKANRAPTPEDLIPQLPFIREVTRAFNIHTLELEGYEADDIIGTLAAKAPESVDTVIVSSDKDLMQLVDERTSMLDTMKDVRYGPPQVFDKMGVRPDQVIDFLALMGDKVDNIPGVTGIGKKGAAALLATYDDLDGIYADLDAFKGKRRENLTNDRDAAYLSQELATICLEVPVGTDVAQMTIGEPNRDALAELFRELEFRTWYRRYHDGTQPDDVPQISRDAYQLVRTSEELDALASTLEEADVFAFDTETTSLRPMEAALVGLSFAVDAARAWYVPIAHRTLDAHPQLSPAEVLGTLGPLLADPARPKCAQNGKYDTLVLAQAGVEVRGLTFDTMLASYLVAADRRQHDLDSLALDHLSHKTIKFSDVAGKGADQITFDAVPVETARDYACEDAAVVLALKPILERQLTAMNLRDLYDTLELPLAGVLAEMESHGVRIDGDLLREVSSELGSEARTLEAEAHRVGGRPFDLGSPKQLSGLLFGELGLTPIKKTKTGFSTDESVLVQLAQDHPLPDVILRWRHITKLKSTYTDKLPQLVNPQTGRIHTSYNQAVAATGRLSSTDPNLQNIPVRSESGRRIREAFIPDEGHVLLAADYSQIELRVLAHLSGDESLLRSFREGADVHQRTASELFGTPAAEVTRDQRNLAKSINFGLLYGMSAFRLAREQGISRGEAQAFIDRYFGRFPRVLAWKEETLAYVREHQYVTTLLGRVRRLPEIGSKRWNIRAGAERMAINTPVQGTAADIMKLAMIAVDERLKREAPDVRMIMQVHDELVFEVPRGRLEPVQALVVDVMERVVDLNVPMVVNASTGANWLEAH